MWIENDCMTGFSLKVKVDFSTVKKNSIILGVYFRAKLTCKRFWWCICYK